jgi:ubiquinone/menaquinone biosynthesis C-methylase UbiE
MTDSRFFANFWSFSTRHESAYIRDARREVAGAARGRVLEIGCGVGTNFEHYGDGATEIVATEPSPYMLPNAREAASAAARAIQVVPTRAEALPFMDGSFDAVVSTANMCSIDDPRSALGEIRRVLKPGGEYRFFDHVAYDHAFGRFWQNLVVPVWTRFGGGCHPNRDIAGMVREAGFADVRIEFEKRLPPVPPIVIVRPHIRGVATA